jgi:ABC-2 type transport system ATP-binding protein
VGGLADAPPAPQGAPLPAGRGLVGRFGRTLAVDDVGFEIAPGEAYGLLGPNGAGQTSTISLLCGRLDPDAGEVTVAGASLRTGPTAVKAAIGYVPQEIALYPDLAARENLTFLGRLYGIVGREQAARSAEVLELVELEHRAGERIDTDSGGMRRRVTIAAGLLQRPKRLVLGEPPSASTRRAATPSWSASRG